MSQTFHLYLSALSSDNILKQIVALKGPAIINVTVDQDCPKITNCSHYFYAQTCHNQLDNTYGQVLKIWGRKIVNIFLPIILNICFGCSKEPSHRDGSFEHQKHIQWLNNKKKSFLTLNVPIATKVVCFSRLLICLRNLYGKQCGPRSDCSYWSSLFWVHTVCFYT